MSGEWLQFVKFFSEKNSHLSYKQATKQAEEPYRNLKAYFEQKGGSGIIKEQKEDNDDVEQYVQQRIQASSKGFNANMRHEDSDDEIDECVIEGKIYLRDFSGTIYDAETEEKVGKYDFKKKKWISKRFNVSDFDSFFSSAVAKPAKAAVSAVSKPAKPAVSALAPSVAHVAAPPVAPVAAPAAPVAAPVNLEPYITAYLDLYRKMLWGQLHESQRKQVGDVFRERLATIGQPIVSIYGVGYASPGGGGRAPGGGMISYVITNMGIYGITVRNLSSQWVLSKPIHIYQFTNEVSPVVRSIFESYSREPYFDYDDTANQRPSIKHDFRKRFQALYTGIPGQQLVNENGAELSI